MKQQINQLNYFFSFSQGNKINFILFTLAVILFGPYIYNLFKNNNKSNYLVKYSKYLCFTSPLATKLGRIHYYFDLRLSLGKT